MLMKFLEKRHGLKVAILLAAHAVASDCVASNDRGSIPPAPLSLDQPRAMPRAEELGRKPRNQYGSLEEAMQSLRAHRPLDLSVAPWRRGNPEGSFQTWAQQARALLSAGLNCDPGKLELNSVT